MKYLDELINKLQERNIDVVPCNEDEKNKIKEYFMNVNLPLAYKEFIYFMGKSNKSEFMRGDSCYLDEVFNLQAGAKELLKENESRLTISENEFVFWMSQGGMFCMFKLNAGDNPPIYLYNEMGEDRFVKIANSITEFLIGRLEQTNNLFKEK